MLKLNRSGSLFLIRFVGTIMVLYLAISLKPVDRAVITPFTAGVAKLSAATLRLIDGPAEQQGTQLTSRGFTANLRNGCNGLEATLLLLAAVGSFPASWKHRLIGIGAGLVLIQALNLIRVVTLVILGRDYPHLFELFHVTVWQVVIFALTAGMFVWWSSRIAAPARSAANP